MRSINWQIETQYMLTKSFLDRAARQQVNCQSLWMQLVLSSTLVRDFVRIDRIMHVRETFNEAIPHMIVVF